MKLQEIAWPASRAELRVIFASILFAAWVCGQFALAADSARGSGRATLSEGVSSRLTGLGKGLFVTGPRAMTVFPDRARANRYATGFQIPLTWAELEPAQGRYDWSRLDQLLADCKVCDKQAAFKFVTVGGKVMSDSQLNRHQKRAADDALYNNDATPAWLFADPAVKRLGGIPTPKGKLPWYPVFWDPAYQAHLEKFIQAMAARYDGNPRLEYIRMGGWQVGTGEPSFYGGASEYLTAQLAAAGMTHAAGGKKKDLMRNLPGNGPYARAVVQMMDTWRKHFTRTRLAATIHFSKEEGSFEEAMMRYCLAHQITFLNTGLNEGDKAETRKLYRDAYDQHACPVGWGGITHIGTKQTKEELAARGHSLRLETVMQGIGDDNDPPYRPASKVSYLVFGFDFLEDEPAMKWASARLAAAKR